MEYPKLIGSYIVSVFQTGRNTIWNNLTKSMSTYLHPREMPLITSGNWKRIKQDKKHPGVLIELRKSTALWDIAYFVRNQVITLDDLEGFSKDLIDAVKLILSR